MASSASLSAGEIRAPGASLSRDDVLPTALVQLSRQWRSETRSRGRRLPGKPALAVDGWFALAESCVCLLGVGRLLLDAGAMT